MLAGYSAGAPTTSGVVQEQPFNGDPFVGRLQLGTWTSFRSFGTSCAGSAGLPSLAGIAPAFLCSTMQVQATGLAPNKIGVLNFGPEIAPISLAGIGAPGCVLVVSPPIPVPLVTGPAGTATFALAIPNVPAFLGGEVAMQYFFLDAGANPLGVVTTNGLTAIVRW